MFTGTNDYIVFYSVCTGTIIIIDDRLLFYIRVLTVLYINCKEVTAIVVCLLLLYSTTFVHSVYFIHNTSTIDFLPTHSNIQISNSQYS